MSESKSLCSHFGVCEQYDKVLLDPPRLGAENILPYFKIFNPERILYISCNPKTLPRDANILVKQYGYCLAQVGVIDMFPYTKHVEAMALFTKRRFNGTESFTNRRLDACKKISWQ